MAMPTLWLVTLFCSALLLSLSTSAAAAVHKPKKLNGVVVKTLPQQFRHAENKDDINLLFETGLDFDIAMNTGKAWQLRGLAETMISHKASFKWWEHVSLMVFKNNKLYLAGPKGVNASLPGASGGRAETMLRDIAMYSKSRNLQWPDSIFVMNFWDEPVCPVDKPDMCKAPVMSLIKDWDEYKNTSTYSDIILPFFSHNCEVTADYPWEKKKAVAIMRAGIQASMKDNCTRIRLVNRVSQEPSLRQILDVGLTSNRKRHLHLDLSPYMEIRDHAQWKYMLSTDGVTATCRLCKLLGVNSIILKEASPWVEYYGRPLKAEQNFFGFTVENVTEVIKEVEKMPVERLQAMIQRNQEYQQMYTTFLAKVFYVHEAVQRYTTLFPEGEMERFVQSLDDLKLTNFPYLMGKLMAWPRSKVDSKKYQEGQDEGGVGADTEA